MFGQISGPAKLTHKINHNAETDFKFHFEFPGGQGKNKNIFM